jgi:D-alanyl-D-alanine carboxypeptidase
MNPVLCKHLQGRLEEGIHTSSVVGATGAIRIGRGEVWLGAAGNSDLSARTSMNPDERFLVYSLTKTFTATLILQLVQSGTLSLDDLLSRWLSRVPHSSRVTIRQVLNHTSGIPDYGVLPEYHRSVRQFPSKPWSFEEFTERTLRKNLDFGPGSGWSYSNTSYMLLRRLIEVVTNQSYDRVMTDTIFTPLGLEKTSIITTVEAMRQLVPGYSNYLSDGHQVVDVRDLYHPGWAATGVLASTARDIASFYHELLAGDILSTDLKNEMLHLVQVTNQHLLFKRPGYGLGIMADSGSRYGTIYGHTGEGPGYCAAAYHARDFPGHPVTICVLCNSEGGVKAESILFSMLQAFEEVL